MFLKIYGPEPEHASIAQVGEKPLRKQKLSQADEFAISDSGYAHEF